MMGRPPKTLPLHRLWKLRQQGWTLRSLAEYLETHYSMTITHTTIMRRLKKFSPPINKVQHVVIRYETNYTQYVLVGKRVHTIYKDREWTY